MQDMKSKNELVEYRENIFTRILSFFKNIFSKKNVIEENNEISEASKITNDKKESFLDSVVVKEDEEEKRLKALQIQYDNGEISEEDISKEDTKKLIEMYNKETEEIKKDIERRKKHIIQMREQLKNS